MNKPVEILTIKDKLPLYKKDELAEKVELILLEEVGFEIVAQKGLYEIGDKAVYIQPDYNLSDIPLFENFLRPNGDVSKSMLGKVNGVPLRIRAKKFNLSKETNGEPVYSNGILLPYHTVTNYLAEKFKFHAWNGILGRDLTKELNITKYEEPEYTSGSGMVVRGAKPFPQGLYKTDETNIHNAWGSINFPLVLIGTEKVDGSSITIGVTPQIPEGFICSRNMRKPLFIKKHVGRRKKTLLEKIMFWKNPDLNKYEMVESDDDFIKYGKPYLDLILLGYTNLILRGELNGGNLKGSGNKNNPASKEKPNIKFFGSDTVNESGIAVKDNNNDFITKTNGLEFPRVKNIFTKRFESREQLEKECNDYFKENMIEGIVVRSLDSKFSAKIMNLEYDAKK